MSSHWDRKVRRIRLMDGTKVEINWEEVYALSSMATEEWFSVNMRAGPSGPPDGRRFFVNQRTYWNVMNWLHYLRTGKRSLLR